MAYNTKPIATDVNGNPVSQYYNPVTDQYEPVEGSNGANKVMVQNNDLSLLPILDRLSQLTGTVIDEETRKSNELQRVVFYDQLQRMLADGDLKGDKGDIGIGLEFDWKGTSLGVRLQGEENYIYVNLKGERGERGLTGSIDNLDENNITEALGYLPVNLIEITETNPDNYYYGNESVSALSGTCDSVDLPSNNIGFTIYDLVKEVGELKARIISLEKEMNYGI